MEATPLTMHGPFEVQVLVTITDGTNFGEATVVAKRAHYPTQSEVKASVEQALEQLPDGYRPPTKQEWFDHTFGMRVAIPGSDDWDELDEG